MPRSNSLPSKCSVCKQQSHFGKCNLPKSNAARPSALTMFDRATPAARADIRRRALAVPCSDCNAQPDEPCRSIGGHVAKPHYARQVYSGARPMVPAPKPEKTAAEEALDEIAALCGCPEWEYPGQVIRDVRLLRERLEAVIGKSAERLALDMDHANKDHSAWWKAVERARRFIAKKKRPAKAPQNQLAPGDFDGDRRRLFYGEDE